MCAVAANYDDSVLERARHIRMVIMDCDGVLTDGKASLMSYDTGRPPDWLLRIPKWLRRHGMWWRAYDGVAFSVQDGSGIKYLQRSGIKTAILTGRYVGAVVHRARVLGIEDVVLGSKVKLEGYEEICQRNDLEDVEVAYVGDDLPDIPVMRRVGLAVAVANAVPDVIDHAHMVTERRGGDGAVRELAEFLLKVQGKWDAIMARYLE